MKVTYLAHRLAALLMLIVLLPVIIFNVIDAFLHFNKVFIKKVRQDVYAKSVELYKFKYGILTKCSYLFPVLQGKLLLCGAPILKTNEKINASQPTGLYSDYQLDQYTGLAEHNLQQSVALSSPSLTHALSVMIRTHIAKLSYKEKLAEVDEFEVFGVKVGNHTMEESLNWVLTPRSHCETGVFVNVNSINLAWQRPELSQHINSADYIMADGSGVRLAAQKLNIQLKQNVNGTDMLPLLCQRMAKTGQKLFLYGASQDAIEACVSNLQSQYKDLQIVGHANGYVQDQQALIEQINQSGADVVLVGLGSPLQEAWLESNKAKLNANTVLAVGGLFDFASGRIPRAPKWMRQLGLEWVFRLMQEPKAKFHRYVIGNPLFMYRMMACEKVKMKGFYR